LRIGILASYEGTTLQAIIDACATGVLPAQVVTVVSNNRDAEALQRARAAGVATHHLSSSTHPEPEALDAAICGVLVEHAVDIVVLAGYMKKVGSQTLARFRGRVLNTHPALLPKFGGKGMYGLHVHRAVLAAGEAKSGASVHLVNDEYDAGPVIAQFEVPVAAADTPESLAERVQERERAIVVEVLGRIADRRIRLPMGQVAERLLFLPGAGGNPTFWKPLVNLIKQPGDPVLLAWLGAGSNVRRDDIHSLDDLYRLVVDCIDRPVDLVAQSMGGVLALRAALDFPDKVRHLVLTATSGGLDMTRFGAADWRPAWRKERPSESWWADDKSNFEDRLVEINAPTLLLFGDADPISPVAVGQHLASGLRCSDLVIIKGGDHGFARDRAEEIAPHVQRHLLR